MQLLQGVKDAVRRGRSIHRRRTRHPRRQQTNSMQNGDGDTKVYGINILYDVLQDGDNVTIEKYAELSSDMLELDGSGDNTILHYIVEEGYVELLEHFSDKVTELEGQEWAQKYGISQRTLLSSTCEREQPSLHILQLFVERFGVDVNVKLRGETALHILAGDAHCWQVEALEYLISKGATIEARNVSSMTPLLMAFTGSGRPGVWNEETLRVLYSTEPMPTRL